ncbi:ATP synthase subunit d, mitochondrial [Eumeta japonica]|uniref:ATP synthase subunit d, mitochondrial n=1 Tax=Eumeta variegata TaxID=151549 RepID=A0A4C1WBE1_EUMVA|nr:ATP synthase subunit d, mitochondrial [Eumeta japonica]
MANRFKKPSINWPEMARRVPPDQKGKFISFKAKSETYLRKVMAHPEVPPKIDWDGYRKVMPVAGLVEKFQKSYESFTVPYPKDTLSDKVDQQWTELQGKIKEFVAASNENIKEAEAQLAVVRSLPPFESMTMEIYRDLYPEQALDPVNRPTFWPHAPEDQLGYEDREQKAAQKGGGH